MKKVIFQMSVSLDGYIKGPNHEIDWHLVDDEFNSYAMEMLKASDVLIMGRRTYQLMAGAWPTDTDNDPVALAPSCGPVSLGLVPVSWRCSRSEAGRSRIERSLYRRRQRPADGCAHPYPRTVDR
jgi:RibD C-terminal domain